MMAETAEDLQHTGGLQVVKVRIGSETFALDANIVREIIDPIPATRVAGARTHLDRIVNVRGNVVPLADIRERFGMAPVAATQDTRFVVIEVGIGGDPVVVALVADKVFEVAEVETGTAQQVPKVGTSWRPEYVKSIVKCGDEFRHPSQCRNYTELIKAGEIPCASQSRRSSLAASRQSSFWLEWRAASGIKD